MKFSVIAPVYNVEPYIRQCVDSILCQSYPDFELILVDDGSPDRCPAICDDYAATDCRVQVIHQANEGVSAARNAGVRSAAGDYLIFADSDDFLPEPRMLEELNALLTKSDADLILFRVRAWRQSENSYRIKNKPFNFPLLDRFDRNATLHYIFSEKQFPVGVYAVCVKRKLITDRKISFADGLKSEDYDWLLTVLRESRRIYATDSVYYTYRMHRPGSITSNVDLQHIRDLMKTVSKWAAAPGFSDETLQKDVRNYAAYIYSTALVVSGRISRKLRKPAMKILKQDRSAMRGAIWPELRLIRFAQKLLGTRLTSSLLQLSYRCKLKRELKKQK